MMDATGQEARRRFARAVAQADRLLGAVAHQVGAAMLPSSMVAPDLEGHRAWRRLVFVTEALSEHVRGEKRALDQLRGSPAMDTVPMEADDWCTWFPELLAGFVERDRVNMRFELQGLVPCAVPRAVALLLHWVQALDPEDAAEVRIAGPRGDLVAEVRGVPAASAQLPVALHDAWSALGDVRVEHDGDLLAIRCTVDTTDA